MKAMMVKPGNARIITCGLFAILFSVSIPLHAQESLELARQRPPGSVVTINGLVLNGNELGPVRYIQDSTAGIAAYPGGNSPSGFEQLTKADEVQVTGVLSIYRGLLEINPILSYQMLSSNNPLPSPRTMRLDQMRADAQGTLIRIPCTRFIYGPGTFESGNHAIYGAEGIRGNIYLEGNHPMINTAIPVSPVEIVAIASHYDRPRLLIRSAADITPADCFHISPVPEQSDIAPFSFQVTWTSDGIADGFCSITDEIGTTEIFQTEVSGETHQMTFTDLQPAEFYHVRVGAVDMNGDTAMYPAIAMSSMSLSSGEIAVYFNESVNSAFSNGATPAGTSFNAMLSSVMQLIANAETTIDVAMYNSNRADIISALEQAAQRGIRVRYIGDGGQSNSALDPLPDFPLMFRYGDGIMHHKFMVADPHDPNLSTVWMGSTNHSTNQLASDPNNTVVIRDQALAKAYLREFEEMWGGTGDLPNSLMSRTGSAKLDDTPHLFQVGEIMIESYFSPSDNTHVEILSEVRSADTSVDVALLLLTRYDLAAAMASKKYTGLRVRLIVEDLEGSLTPVQTLLSAGIPVEHHDYSSIFHHKYAILDEGAVHPRVITGSHNWTTSAAVRNDENTLIIHDRDVANIYRQEFEARWAELSPTGIDIHAPDIPLTVYPIPASERLTFETDDAIVRATVWTLYGVPAIDRPLADAQLDISTLPPGIYLLQVLFDGDQQTYKTFVKL